MFCMGYKCIEELEEKALNGEDPFGLVVEGAVDKNRTNQQLNKALAGKDPEVISRIKDKVQNELDHVTKGLIQSMGMNPDVVWYLKDIFRENMGENDIFSISTEEEDEEGGWLDDKFVYSTSKDMWIIDLDRQGSVVWNSNGTITFLKPQHTKIPDSVITSLPGKPLRTYLSHDAMDLLDVTIQSVVRESGGEVVITVEKR